MFTGMPATRRREVGAVIEVEAAQVVLVRLALAAVLADDDARHGFEHFAGAHDRPRVELPRRDRALARRLRDADEVLGRSSASARFVNVRLPVTVTSALSARCSTTLIGACGRWRRRSIARRTGRKIDRA